MVRISKQDRKYKKEKEPRINTQVKFKILINGANFLKERFDTYEAAELHAQKFCKGSNSTYIIMEST